MCSAIWDDVDYYDEFDGELLWPDGNIQSENNPDFVSFKKPNVRSEFVPIYPMPLSSFDIDNKDISLKAEELSELFDEELLSEKLSLLVDEYYKWIEGNISRKKDDFDLDIFDNIIKNELYAYDRMK